MEHIRKTELQLKFNLELNLHSLIFAPNNLLETQI